MSAIVVARANNFLDASLGTASFTAFTGAAKLRLTTTAPTNSAAGTELGGGTGYTTGGITLSFSSGSGSATTGPTSLIQITNGSGGTWSIVGLEIWDTAGSPLRWWWGLWTGQPISVPNTNIFQVNIGGISVAV